MKLATKSRRDTDDGDQGFSAFLTVTIILAGAVMSAADFAQTQSAKHTIRVTFDYDFTAIHACTPKVTKKCVAQFVVYDISAGKPYKLFSIPAPPGACGPVKSITGDSQPLLFESGKHLFAVTAQLTGGEESDPRACKTWAAVP
jgi:hypothetical protein